MKIVVLLIALFVVFSLALADALSTIHYRQPEVIYVNQHGERLPLAADRNVPQALAEGVIPTRG